jgi:hypothetical protein
VIRVDVGIVWRSFDKYKFGHGLPSGCIVSEEEFQFHNPTQHDSGSVQVSLSGVYSSLYFF